MSTYIYPTFDKPKKIIDLNGISQSYNNGVSFVLKDLNFAVTEVPEKGKFVGLLGASGSGKSTILRYIAGLQMPTTGKVLINGKPAGADNRVSVVFQEYSSMPWYTVLENVSLALQYRGVPRKEREEKAMEMIKLVGLDGHQHKYAQIPGLSGGQLQRVAIARSLLANSNILLMDEPFGALDINTRLQMQDLLLEIQDKFNMYIIFVTHDISEAVYLSDSIYMLKRAPALVAEEVEISLSGQRTRALKRDPHFIDLVYQVEDIMVKLSEDPGGK
ncbi:MAG: ABC transporter ATP-binding protein [Saprospiraceae bacterium]|nr:ABC transporter ATP-binding protein [Saprospiraceae bacterium]